MKSQNDVILAGAAVVAAAVIAFAVGFMRQEADVQETRPIYVYNTQTTEAATAEELEYVTNETWDAMLKAYHTIAANQEEAVRLIGAGLADPDGTVNHAAELVEFGKNCERDSLLNADAERFLQELSDTADKLTAFIHTGGGETAAEIDTTVDPDTQEDTDGIVEDNGADIVDEVSASGEGSDVAGTETLAGRNNTTVMSEAAEEDAHADAGDSQENMTIDSTEPAETTAPGTSDISVP